MSSKGLLREINKTIREGPEEEKSRLQKAFDKEVNDYRLSFMKYTFVKDGRINARGRVFFKLMVFLLSLTYLATESNLVEMLTYVSVMTIVMPVAIDLVTKFIVSKQKINEGNLYDMLYVFGLYLVTMAPLVAAVCFAVKKLKDFYPGMYDSFTGFPLCVCIIAVILLAVDVAAYFRSKRKES